MDSDKKEQTKRQKKEQAIKEFKKFKKYISKKDHNFYDFDIDPEIIFTYQNKQYINNTYEFLILKKSNIKNAGAGVFAQCDIPAYTHIGNYSGKLYNRRKDNSFNEDYTITLYKHYVIDGNIDPKPLTVMVNDIINTDFEYNCEFKLDGFKSVQLWSIKDIKRGEELYVDYGHEYWDSRKE